MRNRFLSLFLMLLAASCLMPQAYAAAGTSPIYTATPHVSWSSALTSANTAMDGTGTVSAAFTAGSNGSYIYKIRVKSLGTTSATVIRVFINNGSTNATAANNLLYGEITVPSITASNSQGNPDFDYPVNIPIQANYVVNVCEGTATSSPGVIVGVFGGDY